MCPISLMCLIFYKFKLLNIFGQDNKIIRVCGYFGKQNNFHVFLTFYVICNIFSKHIRHIRDIGHMN